MSLQDFLASHSNVMLIEISETSGSVPRGTDAFMLVSETRAFGTIGGGSVEHEAVQTAREMLRSNCAAKMLSFTLGPDRNQCCGGRINLLINRMNEGHAARLANRAAAQQDAAAHVLIFGAGHVGFALASALRPLPFQVSVFDSRDPKSLPGDIAAQPLILPEHAVRNAPAGSAIVIMTHDHGLDYAIVLQALARDNLAYVGLIGSKTKRNVFRSQALRDGLASAQFERLVCPIGANDTGDKRPEVIAAFVAAELCKVLLGQSGKRHYIKNREVAQ